MDAHLIRGDLVDRLQSLVVNATKLVESQVLAGDIPPLLREVLEEKRARGSESTFICGRIDVPRSDFPDGRVVLSWMGDSRLRLWGPDGERTAQLGDTFLTEQRWSTRHGPVRGLPHLLVASYQIDGYFDLARLAVYSDGLGLLDQLPVPPPNYELDDLITRTGQSPTSDDISFLDILLEPSSIGAGKRAAISSESFEGHRSEDRIQN
jgi:hypothetical protein